MLPSRGYSPFISSPRLPFDNLLSNNVAHRRRSPIETPRIGHHRLAHFVDTGLRDIGRQKRQQALAQASSESETSAERNSRVRRTLKSARRGSEKEKRNASQVLSHLCHSGCFVLSSTRIRRSWTWRSWRSRRSWLARSRRAWVAWRSWSLAWRSLGRVGRLVGA